MKAKEMFEKLGYEINTENEKELLYKAKWEISTSYYICFDFKLQSFECFVVSDSPFTPPTSFAIDLELLQAINKQIEELGWLDNE